MSLLVPDTGLLFWMTLSFGIVLFILIRYAFPTITKALDARNEHIIRSLEEAREAQHALAGVKEEANRMREEANRKYAAMVAEAGEVKKKLLEEARASAEQETAEIREKAHREIDEYRRQAIKQAGDMIVDLSTRIAEKTLRQKLDTPPEQKEVINRLLAELELNKN